MLDDEFDAPYLQQEVDRLKGKIEDLKVDLENASARIERRDATNGRLLAEIDEKEEYINNIENQLENAAKAHDDKSITNCDLMRRNQLLASENMKLLARIGKLTDEADVTWQESLDAHIRKICQEEMSL